MNWIYSPVAELEQEVINLGGRIPLAWAASVPERPLGNFGDALSPIVALALSGLDSIHRDFDSSQTRMTCCGTIGHEQRNGHVVIWGTGVDPKRNTTNPSVKGYIRPPNTSFTVCATRGPFSAKVLRAADISCPEIFGDPGWLLPKIFSRKIDIKHELGIVMHISELETPSSEALASASINRYRDAEQFGIKMISTYHEPTIHGFLAKLDEMLSCRRILSSSFHGLVIPLSYGIPGVLLSENFGGGQIFDVFDDYEAIDHRFADFYAGAGKRKIAAYCQPKQNPTNWTDVRRFIDAYGEPFEINTDDFVDALPLRKQTFTQANEWTISQSALARISW